MSRQNSTESRRLGRYYQVYAFWGHVYSEDGKHYYALNGYTLEPENITYYGKPVTWMRRYPNYPWGLMNYNKPMTNDRFWELEGLAEEVAGRKTEMSFSDTKEDEEFDRIGRNMT
jgi:hypothetical protein